MGKINILSEDVVGKISAGEVVERPASVVKELIENSIDAGADSIEIEIQGAGQALIRVADNGAGMTPEDAKNACLRHSTSKIKNAGDLDNIETLGFRGEALASIAAVSQMDLTSRTQSGDTGVYVYLESGEILKVRPVGRAKGTTVEVRNLFYNVPARRKFLKKSATELSEIVNVVGRFIVAYTDIEFKLTHENRCILHATKNMDMAERIHLVLGADFADHMVDISSSEGKYKITGYVSRPACTRNDRRGQVFYVNGRYVRSKALSDAVYVAYSSMLERGRYPSVALFLFISPTDVDVNVHPTKLEVKFDDERSLKDAVRKAIRVKFDKLRDEDPGFIATHAPVGHPERPVFTGSPDAQTEFEYDVTELEDKRKQAGPSWDEPSYGRKMTAGGGEGMLVPEETMFQVGDCYIVQIEDNGIMITDQHAAHERIFYEVFSGAQENKPIEKQNLLFPVRIDLSAGESVIMEKVIGDFKTLGFEIEPFGDNSFIVQAAPAAMKDRGIKTVIVDVLNDLGSSDLKKIDLLDELIKITSCRAAIKAGDKLTVEEMSSLLEQLKKCELPFTCPHGRPTMTRITLGELEKMFRRK